MTESRTELPSVTEFLTKLTTHTTKTTSKPVGFVWRGEYGIPGESVVVVQWCEEQKAFHVESTDTLASMECTLFFANRETLPSYRTLAVFKTEGEAFDFIDMMARQRGLVFDDQLMRWRDTESPKLQ